MYDRTKVTRTSYPPKNLSNKTERILKTSEDKNLKCIYHQTTGHDINSCRTFGNLSYQERRKFAEEKKLCFKCLGEHRRSDCKSKVVCSKCEKPHSVLMHYDRITNVSKESLNKESEKSTDSATEHVQLYNSTNELGPQWKDCSKTVLTEITHPTSNVTVQCYTIIDEQSSTSFVDSRAASLLNVTGPEQDFKLTTMTNSKKKTSGTLISGLIVRGVFERERYSLPPIYTSESIPDCKHEVATPFIVSRLDHISDLSRHFPEIDQKAEVMLLLGRNCGDVMKTRCYGDRFPFAHHTALGWALVGSTCTNKSKNSDEVVLKLDHEHFDVVPCFPEKPRRINSDDVFLESVDDDGLGLSKEDLKFITILENGLHVNEEGFLTMPLPFKDKDVLLPDNSKDVYLRTKNTLFRLRRKPDKLGQCILSMEKNLLSSHVEKVPSSEIVPLKEGRAWWLPVFPVTQKRKQKTRLVFDSSASYKGFSLNDALLTGPDGNSKLRGVLIRFRWHQIGFSADIESMFYNFYLDIDSKDFTRFYWFQNNDPNKSLEQYRGCVHLFGNRPSPAIAHYGLIYAAAHSDTNAVKGKKFINENFYVDDGLASCRTAAEASSTLKEAINILAGYNIRLHKIASNCKEVTDKFPESEMADVDKDNYTQGVLGMCWDLTSDLLYLNPQIPNKAGTRRGILSMINSQYDPVGIIGPVALTGKILQRRVFMEETEPTDWDDPLPDQVVRQLDEWRSSLLCIGDVRLPRSYNPNNFGKIANYEIHVFADAFEKAIGCVANLKMYNETNDV